MFLLNGMLGSLELCLVLILKKLMLRIDINFWSQERKRCYLTSLKGKGIQNRHFLVVIMLEIAQHFLLLLPVAY